MMCPNCNIKMTAKILPTYKYLESGLKNVILHNIPEFRCTDCGEVYYQILNINQLHELIAASILRKEEIEPEELRFLRTYTGLSKTKIAEMIDYNATTIGRYETGAKKPQQIYVKFLKMLVQYEYFSSDYDAHEIKIEAWNKRNSKKAEKISLWPSTKSGWDFSSDLVLA